MTTRPAENDSSYTSAAEEPQALNTRAGACGATSNDPRTLYPASYGESQLVSLCNSGIQRLSQLMPGHDDPRVPGWFGAAGYPALVEKYSRLPARPVLEPHELVRQMVEDLLAGAVNWRSPEVQYNLGAAVNVVTSAMYALALDANVYLINDGLAGNAMLAEQVVGRILAGLAGVDTDSARGVFTFGGTGTMVYAIKAGIRKAAPESVRRGVPGELRVVITEDAHFSHETAADWLGIGSEALITIPAARDRCSDLDAAEALIRSQIEGGAKIATIIVNGGTTYDHTVDDIAAFAQLRDRLVVDYQLPYRPHLHVDSVVGWAWLMFHGHDFASSDLDVGPVVTSVLARQYQRIRAVRHADSWGVDFHKGVGGCPVDCSFVQFNDKTDLAQLRKGGTFGVGLHQLAEEFSSVAPVDYTLETSRAGGKALAALAAFHSVGQDGYRQILAKIMEATLGFRRQVATHPGMTILNEHALGYQSMVRLLPPGREGISATDELQAADAETAALVREGNAYLKAFFAWDNDTRMNINAGGVLYSFSGKYLTTASGAAISGLKFYPTTPLIDVRHMTEAVDLLLRRKMQFDAIRTNDGH